MFDILWYLFLAAIAITVVAVAIKVAIALLPVALVIGGICVIGLIFCNDDCGQVENISKHAKSAQKHVKSAKFKVINYHDGIQRHYHEQIKSMTRQKSGVNFESVHPALDSAISVVVWAYCIATGDETFKPLCEAKGTRKPHPRGTRRTLYRTARKHRQGKRAPARTAAQRDLRQERRVEVIFNSAGEDLTNSIS